MPSTASSLTSLLVLIAGVTAYGVAACADTDTIETGFEEYTGVGGAGTTTSGGGGIPTTTGTGASPTTSSSSPTTSTASMTTSGTTTSSTSSTGTGGACNDTGQGEPGNNSESGAVDLGTLGDEDGPNTITVQGMLAGSTDVDWYKYFGDDTSSGIVDPTRNVSSSETIRICKFIECPDNDQNFDCPANTTPETSPGGRTGCCGSQGFTIDFICGSFSFNDDSADVYIRFDSAPAQSCPTYSATIHF